LIQDWQWPSTQQMPLLYLLVIQEKYILPIDQFRDSLAEHIQHTKIIDAVIPMTDGLDTAIALKRSFLTTYKSSEFAQAYREAAYSILEELNLI
jgi:cellulose biosynthesis protein BcsQ